MPKASRRKRLSSEEKHQLNNELEKEAKKYQTEDAERYRRIVDTLSFKNLLVYILAVLLPPVGLWYIWTRRVKLHLTNSSVYAWTVVCIIIMFGYIKLIIEALNV